MEKITQSITLDLVEISHNVVNARQGDRLTRDLIITITNNGKGYEIPNSSYVYLRGKRADGGSVFYSVTMKDMNTVHVDIHDYLMSYPGRCKLDIGIYDRLQSDSGNESYEIASTEPFILYIPDEVFDENSIVDSDEGSTLSQLIHSARDQIDNLQAKLDAHYFVLTEDKDVSGGVPSLDDNAKVPIAKLYEATTADKGITMLTDSVTSNSTTTAATPNSVKTVYDKTLSVENDINAALNNKLPLSGGTMTGTLNLKPNVYDEAYAGALNAQNSNIYGINSLLFADLCDSAKEGIQFYRTGTSVDTLWGKNGVLYWTPNRTFGTVGTNNYEILNSNNYTSYCAKASHAHSYLPLSGGNMAGTIYFTGDHNSSGNYGYISHSDNTLTIKAPGNNGSGMGLEFLSCGSGILPTYATLKGAQNLGSSSQSFGNIYSNGATVSTSDQKEKKDIVPLNSELDTFNSIFDRTNFIKFRWKDNHNGALESSPSCRYHYGVIAQEVENLMHEYGLTNYDNGFIHSNFFLDNTTKCYITGGYRSPKDGYDYSQNVWNYKNDEKYEIFNEVIEESFANLNRGDKYKHRPEIQYILIQDISKVRAKGKQPPVTINSVTLVNKEGNQVSVPLTSDGGIACYSPDDINFETPGSHAAMNENGSITISFDDMWCSYMLKIADDENCFNIYDYESIIADVDYIGEYKIYLIPKGNYLTCDFWNDRDRTDEIAYDYSFNYQEFTNMCLAVLQQTRKDYIDYKTSSESRICELETKISQLEECIKNLAGGD